MTDHTEQAAHYASQTSKGPMITERAALELPYGLALDVAYIVEPREADIGFAGGIEIVSATVGGVSVPLTATQYQAICAELREWQ
ncbi:MAG TPA: hypothetical protein VJ654_00725 [Noviherbaspirillum sp.]|nr:hypothetical protein [Noviherbaspirillum sp.]